MNDQLSIMATVMRASSHHFVGRLGRDPEIRYFESGKCVANVRIAINRPGAKQGDNQDPDWFKVELWGEQAQTFADQCYKGDLVQVVGRIKASRWTDRSTGEEKLDLIITVDQWNLVKLANAPAAAAAAAPAAAQPAHPLAAAWRPNPQQGTVAAAGASNSGPSSDDDIPF